MTKERKTKYVILGMLTIKPMTGYDIRKMMAESTQYFWSESNGQLYPTLAQLTVEKLIRAKEDTVGDKRRVIYSITQAGEKTLQQWLAKEVEYATPRNELLLKIFFGKEVSAEVTVAHIEKHQLNCEGLLTTFKSIETRLAECVAKKERPVYYLLTVKSGVKLIEAEIAWCHEAIELIHQHETIGN